jgi:hypothetical protein
MGCSIIGAYEFCKIIYEQSLWILLPAISEDGVDEGGKIAKILFGNYVLSVHWNDAKTRLSGVDGETIEQRNSRKKR